MDTIERALAKQKKAESSDKIEPENTKTEEIVNAAVQANQTLETDSAVESESKCESEAASAANGCQVTFPLDKLEDMGYVSLSSTPKLVNEELRAIKRKLLNNAFGGISKTLKGSNLITVTSTRPGEGKSFTAINLALSIALEKDKTVLLVDADVLKPSLSKKLEVEEQVDKGLMDFLLDDVKNVSDVIYKTNVDNLRFIPAGRKSHLSTELLASQKMSDLADEFINRYPDRIVIMDSPPLLGINETVVVANLSGQVIIVVEEEKTKQAELKHAISNLDKDKAIGFVMNKSTKHHTNSGYGYGYAYAYAEHK